MLASVLSLLISFAAADPVPYPKDFPTVDMFAGEFRGGFRVKLDEARQSLSSNRTKNTVSYYDMVRMTCPSGNTVEPERPSLQIKYAVQIEDGAKHLTETVTYNGCRERALLSETVSVRGTGLTGAKFSDIVLGQRTFDLAANETERIYSLRDEERTEIVGFYVHRKGPVKTMEVHVSGENVFQVTWTPGEEVSIIRGYLTDSSFAYQRFGKRSSSRIRLTGGRSDFIVEALKNGDVRWTIDRERRTPGVFKQALDEAVLSGLLFGISDVISILQRDMPKTKSVSSGARTGRIVDELNLALSKLQTKTDLNYVEQLVLSYLDAIQKGILQFTDNRPRE